MHHQVTSFRDYLSFSWKLLVLIPILFTACQQAENQKVNPLEEKAREMYRAFNDHNWKAMSEFYAPQAAFLDPSLGTEYVTQSRDEVARKYASMASVFPDIHDELVGVYPSGDKVIVEFISTGKGIDGASSFRLPIISVLTFKDGLIVRDATYYDN